MSVKIICENNSSLDIDNFLQDTYLEENGRKYTLCSQETGYELDLLFQVNNCCIKYTPEKYDKITVELDSSSKKFFEALETKIRNEVDIESVVKSSTLGLKMDKDQKSLCLRDLKRGDYIDAIIKFNNVWTVNSKKYVSLELKQFRKLKIPPKVEIVNYFTDDN